MFLLGSAYVAWNASPANKVVERTVGTIENLIIVVVEEKLDREEARQNPPTTLQCMLTLRGNVQN